MLTILRKDLNGFIPLPWIPSITAFIAFLIGMAYVGAGNHQNVAICWGYALAIFGVRSPVDFAHLGFAIKGAVGGVVLLVGLVNPLGLLS